jgi:long-chain acyl-CoA synthetase
MSSAALMEQISSNPTIAFGTVAVAAALYYIYNSNSYEKPTCSISADQQTQILPGKERVRCSPLLKDGKVMEYEDPAVRTLHDSFLHGLKASNNGDCLGYRPSKDEPYKWLSYREVLDRSQQLASGLMQLGAKFVNDQFIGVISQNRVEWKVTEQACNGYSMVLVPLYDTLGPESITHIMNQCELKIVVVDKPVKAITLLTGVKNGDYPLDTIVVMDTITDDVTAGATDTGVTVKSFDDVLQLGKDNFHDFVVSDLSTFISKVFKIMAPHQDYLYLDYYLSPTKFPILHTLKYLF